ncbi:MULTISPECIES: HD domain-containing protein [unclassified Rhodococcus (in: high G+C Gram-positive bacteria)]|uniref:HD domain-containing protein n=1 Tax=unclassified Rhodococcus (in: high G+C Gram-positive bacteria) TaxID=192944 RepID=UPI001639D08F|nr:MULTISPECIES: HD domain-containing protein [unclassified Rhodococcus (in: high G+C Gram-positive bacteria)]MBC2641920.1 HD domain-containing protein [Rhodococcus sp. 3A]MBC2893339.1 HD domain-containing protein [Rhodococcus sp. 4CII]
MTETIAGVMIPDTKLVSEATELVRDAAPPLLFDHSRRVYLFGMLQGQQRGIVPDPELLYVGAMFHDLGLTEQYRRTDQRFEVDGADEAARFLASQGLPDDVVRRVWTSIALHTTPGIPEFMEPEVALVAAGVETDVLGIGYHDLEQSVIDAVTDAHPRPDFKRRILAAFTEGFKDRPGTTFGTVNADVLGHFLPGFVRDDFVKIIESNAWAE